MGVKFTLPNLADIIYSNDEYGLKSIFPAFLQVETIAKESGHEAKAKSLSLLARACSMMLNPSSKSNPFVPYIVMSARCSTVLDDFSINDLAFFIDIVDSIKDYRVQSRIADILWTVNKPKKIEHVFLAIEGYMRCPISSESFLHDGVESWQRTINLCKSIGKPGVEKLKIIRARLYDSLMKLDNKETYLIFKLAKLLHEIGLDEKMFDDIVYLLDFFAQESSAGGDWRTARDYFEILIDYFKATNPMKTAKYQNELSNTWLEEARKSMENENYIGAGIFFDNAIKNFRAVSKEYRVAYDIENKLHDIHFEMNKANQLSIGNMNVMQTEPMDITKLIEAAVKHVQGRSYPEILFYLAHVSPTESYQRVKESAESTMKSSIFRRLASSVTLASDGRVTARSEGLGPLMSNTYCDDTALLSDMMMHFSIGVGLAVQGSIQPALEEVLREFRITEEMILNLCKSSAIVPVGREEIWTKGLYYGFEGDLAISIHLLSPQLEHFVRMSLKDNGVRTSTISSDGIETENGLATLLDRPEAKEIFDEDLLFEMKALMVNQHGPNLRNEIAHGLLDDQESKSQYGVYLWWRMLRLMLDAVWIEKETGTE